MNMRIFEARKRCVINFPTCLRCFELDNLEFCIRKYTLEAFLSPFFYRNIVSFLRIVVKSSFNYANKLPKYSCLYIEKVR